MKSKFVLPGLFLLIFHFANSQKKEAGSLTDGTITSDTIIIKRDSNKSEFQLFEQSYPKKTIIIKTGKKKEKPIEVTQYESIKLNSSGDVEIFGSPAVCKVNL